MLKLTDKPNLKELSETILVEAKSLIKIAVEEGEQNEQWFLDYLDELNRLSVLY